MIVNTLEQDKNPASTVLRALLPVIMLGLFSLASCDPAKRSTRPAPARPYKPAKPVPGKNEPIDTIRWTPNTGKPPIKNEPNRPGDRPGKVGDTYHIAFLLPFLTNQATSGTVPERSTLALQFYSGAKIALEQVSLEENINLVVDVLDTQASDADFQYLLNTNTRIEKPSVFIGPVRSSHVEILAKWAKPRRKIIVSPDAPSAGLTTQNPDFIQTNPSLQAHCAAITRYVRKSNNADAVTLVCKSKESDRLPYFQNVNTGLGGTTAFTELIVPDAATNFDKADLRRYIKSGRTSVFILPTWSSQDFVMAFLRKLKEVKGSNKVEVYGMPQWRGFEVIDAEYLRDMNVHISASSFIDYKTDEVKAFQQKFYENTGTIPDDDAFNGYDVTLFTARMLARFGLSFPEYLSKETFKGLHANFSFAKVYSNGGLDSGNAPDYMENTQLMILKFGQYGYTPVSR